MSENKVKLITKELKLKKRHPKKSFRLGAHVVGVQFQKFEMTAEEVKELSSVGCKHWIISKEEMEAAKKAKKK